MMLQLVVYLAMMLSRMPENMVFWRAVRMRFVGGRMIRVVLLEMPVISGRELASRADLRAQSRNGGRGIHLTFVSELLRMLRHLADSGLNFVRGYVGDFIASQDKIQGMLHDLKDFLGGVMVIRHLLENRAFRHGGDDWVCHRGVCGRGRSHRDVDAAAVANRMSLLRNHLQRCGDGGRIGSLHGSGRLRRAALQIVKIILQCAHRIILSRKHRKNLDVFMTFRRIFPAEPLGNHVG